MQRPQSLNRQIWAIAWPAVVSNITAPLLGLVDTAIAGHLGSAAALGAIALGSTVFNLIYWLFGFLRMSAAGLTSQACGAGDRRAQAIVLRRGIAMSLAIAAVLVALSPWAGNAVLALLDADDAVQPLAARYFDILIWGAPAMLTTYSLSGWLIGMQNSRLPMAIAIMTNVVNIAASAVFVFALGMQIEGIALGSLISQWLAAAVCVACLWRKYRPEPASVADMMQGARRVVSINADIFLRTLCMIGVTAWFTRAGASQGVEVLSANALLMQLFLLFSYFSDGFAYAGEALAGKFHGSGQRDALRALIRSLFKWGGCVALLFSAAYFLVGEDILRILTDQDSVVITAREFLPWAVSIPLCGIGAFIFDGIYVGLTRTRRMLLSVAVGMAVFFALYFCLRGALGNHALWAAFIAYLIVRGAVLMRL